MITVLIPNLRLTNPLNNSQGTTRGAMFAAARKRKHERAIVSYFVNIHLSRVNRNIVSVRLTRISPGTMDDDGLAASCKSVRDAVAEVLGINDRQPKGFWDCKQEKQGKGVYAVRIALMEVGDV